MEQERTGLIDSAALLANGKFSKDLPRVLQRARQEGVDNIIITGMDLRDAKSAIQMCQNYPGYLYCTVGIHPHKASDWRASSYGELLRLASHAECVGIGECGLDYCRNFSSPQQQKHAFEEQMRLACELQKPMLLHERDAHEDTLVLLNKYSENLPPVLVHCFTGSRVQALKYTAMGFYLGCTGHICKDKRETGIRSLLYQREVPDSRVLLETDAPFMFPHLESARFPKHVTDVISPALADMARRCHPGRNEPCLLPLLCEVVAGCWGKAPRDVTSITTANARRFFNIPAACDSRQKALQALAEALQRLEIS